MRMSSMQLVGLLALISAGIYKTTAGQKSYSNPLATLDSNGAETFEVDPGYDYDEVIVLLDRAKAILRQRVQRTGNVINGQRPGNHSDDSDPQQKKYSSCSECHANCDDATKDEFDMSEIEYMRTQRGKDLITLLEDKIHYLATAKHAEMEKSRQTMEQHCTDRNSLICRRYSEEYDRLGSDYNDIVFDNINLQLRILAADNSGDDNRENKDMYEGLKADYLFRREIENGRLSN